MSHPTQKLIILETFFPANLLT